MSVFHTKDTKELKTQGADSQGFSTMERNDVTFRLELSCVALQVHTLISHSNLRGNYV